MAIVTGSMTDLGLSPIPGLQPRLGFQADAGIDSGTVRIDRLIEVVPNALGVFSVNLAPTDTIRPATSYRLTVTWLDALGQPAGFAEIPGRLYVPADGGALGDLITTDGGAPGLTWVGLEPPAERGPFTSWLRMDPDNIDDFDPASGDYYEWS